MTSYFQYLWDMNTMSKRIYQNTSFTSEQKINCKKFSQH